MTVCPVETKDQGGRTRGAVAIGFSNTGRIDGVATYASIDEARTIVALIENAIADAERIERGLEPLAQAGNPRRDH